MEFKEWLKAIDRAFSNKWEGVSLNEMVDIDYYSIWEDFKDEPIEVALAAVEDELAVQDELFAWVYDSDDS